MALQRTPHWRADLHEVIETHRREPFAFGERDCALFVADCVRAMTGVDVARNFRGTYHSAAGARLALQRAGYRDLLELVATLFDEIPPIRARAGDIAAFPGAETEWSLGIVAGERVTVLRLDGLGTVDRQTATRAFRIP